MLALSPQAAHLWCLRDEVDVEPSVLETCRSLLAPDETARLARLALPKVRRELLLGRALLRTVLSRYAPVEGRAWRFVPGEHGKPELAGPPAVPPLRFNLSHTWGLLAVAVTRLHDVGVDVEHTGRDVSDDRIAERFFARPEAADVAARRGLERRERFFAYWTLKEAYIKARGLGLAVPLHEFWFDLDAEPIGLRFSPALGDDPAAWQVHSFRPSPAHAAALAIRRGAGPALDVEVRVLATAAALFAPEPAPLSRW